MAAEETTRWQYRVEKVTMDADPTQLQRQLDALGAEGWELALAQRVFRASQSRVVAVFKRPTQGDPEQERRRDGAIRAAQKGGKGGRLEV